MLARSCQNGTVGGTDDWWWLRSPGVAAKGAADVDCYGVVDALGNYVDNDYDGVRPALWLNL
jgi:hypothetical protein